MNQLYKKNNLIAKYMGELKIHPDKRKYHKEWDWLMPVVIKISNHIYDSKEHENWIDGKFIINDCAHPVTFGIFSQEGKPMFRFNRQPLFAYDTLIESCYHACVDFIKWYNSQNK
jgi:hypothetical protein